jgi:ATP synthase I chain
MISRTTVTDQDDHLVEALGRRNWLILAILVALSLFWKSTAVTLGVLAGGLVAIIGFFWLRHALVQALADPTSYSAKRFRFSYVVRLASLAAALFLLIAVAKVHPLALVAGLSVVVINLFWTMLQRSL